MQNAYLLVTEHSSLEVLYAAVIIDDTNEVNIDAAMIKNSFR